MSLIDPIFPLASGSRLQPDQTPTTIVTTTSIHSIEAAIWDQLSAGKPFQSHRWYAYGERVMADCLPTYVLIYHEKNLVARAAFWLVRNEPIPKMAGPFREAAKLFFKYHPLLICRSPFANASGLILPEGSGREEILQLLTETVFKEASRKGASFIVFDYLSEADTRNWPAAFRTMQFSDPGTILHNRWSSLSDYLMESRNKKNRRHYKHTIQEIEAAGVKLEKCKRVPDIDAALEIIETVERRHGAFPNPWKRAMLENIELINGTWLDARIDGRLVGGMLLLNDNGAQTTVLPGLAADISHVYFLLLFTSLEVAFENKVGSLRWGSGAYEAKRRLGFELEDNSTLAYVTVHPFLQVLSRWFN